MTAKKTFAGFLRANPWMLQMAEVLLKKITLTIELVGLSIKGGSQGKK